MTLPADAVVSAASFTLQPGEDRVLVASGASAPPLRCASVLKPLLFWAAAGLPPLDRDPGRWVELARPAVTVSANDPTATIWHECGMDALLDRLAGLGGTRWETDPSATPSFGKVMVQADEVAAAYGRLALACRHGDEISDRLLGWMRAVPDRQTFGARDAAVDALGVHPSAVAVKTGWFCDDDEVLLRTHAVTVSTLPDGTVRGTAVLTGLPVGEADRVAYTGRYQQGEEVLSVHQRLAGELIASTTRAVLLGAEGTVGDAVGVSAENPEP